MESILRTVSLEHMDITYLGIGSSPHLMGDQKLDAKHDQLIPVCFQADILNHKKSVRILHFDPHFAEQQSFLQAYFDEWGMTPVEIKGGMSWMNDTMEVIVVPERLEHKDHYWFFEALCESILNTGGKLAIQEYTGYELQDLNQKLYESCDQKEKFKRRILLDMTFGTDSGCCTDMTKIEPFYDSSDNFINLHFLTEAEAKRFIGINTKLDEILKQKYRALYYYTLNRIHVDYRRRLKDEALMYGSTGYTVYSPPEAIMAVLQSKLREILDVLLALRVVSQTALESLRPLFTDYKSYDPYKWYDSVYKTVP